MEVFNNIKCICFKQTAIKKVFYKIRRFQVELNNIQEDKNTIYKSAKNSQA